MKNVKFYKNGSGQNRETIHNQYTSAIMSENQNGDITRTKGYFIYLMIILMLVNMLDSITTVTQSLILSSIAAEFLGNYSENEQNAIMALGGSITTLGFYFIFIAQYLSDKIGRKKILALTAFGMGFMSILVMLSTNYVQYVIFTMFLCFFFSSDIFVIYAQEESKKEKRAVNYSIIQFAGLVPHPKRLGPDRAY